MTPDGWVKNHTAVPQAWGSAQVPPGAIGPVPAVVVDNIRLNKQAGIEVLVPGGPNWVFTRMPHAPRNARYEKR